MTAGQKQFPSKQQQQLYGYGQKLIGKDDISFSDDEDDDDDEDDENSEDEDDSDFDNAAAEAFIAGSSVTEAAAQLEFLQQMQFEEAMRIQMAMKYDEGLMGLRTKHPAGTLYNEHVLVPVMATADLP